MHYDLYWTTGELFRVPIRFDAKGNLIEGTGKNLASAFKIYYDDLMMYVYHMVVEMHFTNEDFNNMPFFDISKLLKIHKERIEEENKRQEQDNKQMNKQYSQMQNNFKMNNNNFKAPKFETPKFNIPKF